MRRIRLSEAAVQACFDNQSDQGAVLLAIYRLVFPDWDDIDKIEGWPSVNDITWKTIAREAAIHPASAGQDAGMVHGVEVQEQPHDARRQAVAPRRQDSLEANCQDRVVLPAAVRVCES